LLIGVNHIIKEQIEKVYYLSKKLLPILFREKVSSIFHLLLNMINYSTKQTLKFPIGLFYNTVVNVKNYKNFVPWCTDSWQNNPRTVSPDKLKELSDYSEHFRNKDVKMFQGGIKVGFNILDFQYTSNVYTVEPNIILSVVTEDSKIFERLDSLWIIKENNQALDVEYTINFEFKNILFTNATGLFLDFIGKNIIQSFIDKTKREVEVKGEPGSLESIEDIVKRINFDTEQEKVSMLFMFENLKGEIGVDNLQVIANKMINDHSLVKKVSFLSELLINDNVNINRIIKEIESMIKA
jgi:coenzyme Q-binding protein COQ10